MTSTFSSCSVELRHDKDFSMSVSIAAPISILKFIYFEQYALCGALLGVGGIPVFSYFHDISFKPVK